MAYLLPILYLLLFYFLIFKVKFFKLEELPGWVPYVVLLLKVIAGVTYYLVHLWMYPIDQQIFFESGKVVYSSIHESWWYYIRLVFGPSGTFLEPEIFKYAYYSNFWSHSGNYSLVRFHALARLFSFGNNLVHVVLMSWLAFMAFVLYYKVLYSIKVFRPLVLVGLLVGLPSLLFWTSSIHKDGLIYFGISICLYFIVKMVDKGVNRSTLFFLFTGIFMVSTVRDYIIILLAPALFVMMITQLFPGRVFRKFIIVYALGAFVVLLITEFNPGFNIYQTISDRQLSFIKEVGGSDFAVRRLYAHPVSIISYFPTALFNSVFRPFPWEVKNIVQMVSCVEVGLLGLLLILALLYRKRPINWHPIIVFFVFYSLTNLLLIGLLLDNSGTLVRYRSVPLSFLTIVLFYMLDFKWIKYKHPTPEE